MSEPGQLAEHWLEVVAPSDLQGGYELDVDGGNNVTYKVRVPPGGVHSGQRFQAVMISETFYERSHNIPTGHSEPGKPVERTLEVVAPSDLQGGFEFFVDAGNNATYKVRVPPGGVHSGQRFQAVIISESSNERSHNIPTGHWRDGICDCFTLGFFHPLLWFTYFCRGCAVGQVLTRMKLNWFGGRRSESSGCSAFKVLFAIRVAEFVWFFSLLIIVLSTRETTTTTHKYNGYRVTTTVTDYPSWVYALARFDVFVFYALVTFLVVITCRARVYIRKKYNIPEQSCDGCEDCCCSFWCNCCTVCQMARHTADYSTYQAACCTENGLTCEAPDVV